MKTLPCRVAIAVALIVLPFQAAAQSFRATYSYLHKVEAEADGYRADMDMLLDVKDGKGVFYSEAAYLRDSLFLLAFDKDGSVKDHTQYVKLSSIPGKSLKNVSFLNYGQETACLSYQFVSLFINGEGLVGMPKWTLSQERKKSAEGYAIKKATALFLGREWEVWYAEDIPLPFGPWLLWGTPGLVVSAKDSEGLFNFRLRGVEKVPESRYSFLWSYYHDNQGLRNRCYDYQMFEAERVYAKLMMDGDYRSQVLGVSSSGNADAIPYIPLIPDEYWRK